MVLGGIRHHVVVGHEVAQGVESEPGPGRPLGLPVVLGDDLHGARQHLAGDGRDRAVLGRQRRFAGGAGVLEAADHPSGAVGLGDPAFVGRTAQRARQAADDQRERAHDRPDPA